MSSPSVTQPPLPTEEEQLQYYYGLKGQPKLVARSNLEVPWELAYDMQHPVPKGIEPVGNSHPLVAKIDTDDYALRKTLHTCLETVDWNSLDVLRIGTTAPRPVILFISVNPGTLALARGFEVAMNCRRVLVNAGCPDVHCEIFEAVVIHHAAAVVPLQRCLLAENVCLCSLNTLTSTLGQSIASKDTPTIEGSLGLFLELVESPGQPAKKMALVSSHAVFEDEQDRIQGYEVSGETDRPSVLMPGDGTFQKISDQVEKAVQDWGTQIQPDLLRMQSHVRSLAPASERNLGSLFYAKPIRPQRIRGSCDSILDYALVELDPSRFSDEFPTLTNTVYTETPPRKLRRQLCHDAAHQHRLLQPGAHRLSGVIPESELSNLPDSGCGNTIEHLRLGKRGNTSGLT